MPGSPDPGNTRTSYRYELDTNTNFVRSRSRTSGPAIKGSDVLLSATSSSSSSQTVTRSPRDLGPTRAPKAPHLHARHCINTLYRLRFVLCP